MASPDPIADRLRTRRVDVLKRSLRDVARLLGISPAHLTDLETGRRLPSEELLVRMADVYGLPLADLRAGFGKPDAVVAEVASQDPLTAEKVPEFLRTARGLTKDQWDRLIREAKKLSDEGSGKAGGE